MLVRRSFLFPFPQHKGPTMKRGRGRPAVYGKNLKRQFASLIRKHGLTGARKTISEVGVEYQVKVGSDERKTFKGEVSLPTLATVAKSANIQLRRGRRAA